MFTMEGNGIIFRNEIKEKLTSKWKEKNKPYSSAKHSWLKNVSILEPKSSGPWGGGEVTLVGCSLTPGGSLSSHPARGHDSTCSRMPCLISCSHFHRGKKCWGEGGRRERSEERYFKLHVSLKSSNECWIFQTAPVKRLKAKLKYICYFHLLKLMLLRAVLKSEFYKQIHTLLKLNLN